jgi:hypothetical protein
MKNDKTIKKLFFIKPLDWQMTIPAICSPHYQN